MALLHQATLTPTKRELLAAWLPEQPWSGGASEFRQLGAYRFDDPADEVGMEAFVLETPDGTVLHVPLSYRGAPLAGAHDHLVGTTEHSVLGTRWVYDACSDPVFATALATAILTGGTEAPEMLEVDGVLQVRQPTATVAGSGSTNEPGTYGSVTARDDGPVTVISADGLDIVVVRVVGTEVETREKLEGRWSGSEPAVLAGLTP